MVEKRVARAVHRVAEVFEKRDEVDVDDVVGLGLRKLDLLVHLDVLGGEVGLVNHAWPTVGSGLGEMSLEEGGAFLLGTATNALLQHEVAGIHRIPD